MGGWGGGAVEGSGAEDGEGGGERDPPDWPLRATCPARAHRCPPRPPLRRGCCCSANGLPSSELSVRLSVCPSAGSRQEASAVR